MDSHYERCSHLMPTANSSANSKDGTSDELRAP